MASNSALRSLLEARPSFRVATEAHGLVESSDLVAKVLASAAAPAELVGYVAAAVAPPRATQQVAVAKARQRRVSAKRDRLLGNARSEDDPRDLARPLVECALRDLRAQQLRSWQASAGAMLGASGTDAPKLSTVEKKSLLTAMRDNAVSLAMLEGHRYEWQAARDAALEAVRIEESSASRGKGLELAPTPKPRLHAVFARFRLEGRTDGLLDEVEASRKRLPQSNGLAYWSAVYHLMAGESSIAHQAVASHLEDRRIRKVIAPLLAPLDAAPQKGFPENFYSYVQNFADDWKLHTLGDKLDSFAALAATPVQNWPSDFTTVVDTALDVAVGTATSSGVTDPDLLDLDSFSEVRVKAERASDPIGLTRGARARRTGNLLRNRAATNKGAAAMYLRSSVDLMDAAALTTFTNAVALGNRVIGALQSWNLAAEQMRDGRPATALNGLQNLQIKLTQYFNTRFPSQCAAASTPAAAWSELQRVGSYLKGNSSPLANGLSSRSAAASLDELYNLDWTAPLVSSKLYAPYDDATDMVNVLLNNPNKTSEKLDLPLLVIGLVFAPLGIADCARRLADTGTAIQTYRQLLRLQIAGGIAPLCQIVEVPMVRIALSQVLHDRGDAEYRGGDRASARSTYAEVLTLWQSVGSYVSNVQSGTDHLASTVTTLLDGRQHPLAHQAPALTANDQASLARLGRDVPVDTISVGTTEGAGADPTLAPHQSLLDWTLPTGSNDANPAIYSVVSRAQSRITQLDAGLNYFGYANGYVPVERFSVLLERARSFTEHAKNAERDYLNFLSQAEEQQYREVGAQQAVTLEKSNVAVEQARVDQARLSATAAQAGVQLAQRTADDAATRVQNYQAFDNQMQDAENLQMVGAALSAMGDIASSAASAGPLAAVGAVGGALRAAGTITSTVAQQQMAHAQRGLEASNLQLAVGEAGASLAVAQAQSATAQQGVVVASLEHGTALLRHDFAVQNLDYLRSGRLLNSDMWFRLAETMRQLSRTALDRAIEIAFLAQQAYAYEADKDVAVIRFDYDDSPEGAFLAADFLSRDLDALEGDQSETLLVRQQQVRLVISLARDAPAALADLQRDGQAVVPVPLRMLESRLPGLHNLRVGTLSVQPVALMDPLRLSVGVTHLGLGQLRRRVGTVRSDESSIGGWLPSLADRWPVAVQVTPPQTYVYTGLSAADAETASPTASRAQDNPFEGVSAASAWHLDIAAERNGIVDGSLIDVLLTFVLTGMHDPELASEILDAEAPPDVRTQYLSAADTFPDAYYAFQRTGELICQVPPDMLGPRWRTARLRNVAFIATPAADASTFTALTSHTNARIEVKADASVTWLDLVPELTIELTGTQLHAELAGAENAHWDFGDGTQADGLAVDHDYARMGAHTLTVAATSDTGARQVWTADIVADPNGSATPPLTSVPSLTAAASEAEGEFTVRGTLPTGLNGSWRLTGLPAMQGNTAQWSLEPGIYRLDVTAMRTLTVTLTCDQRYGRAAPLPAAGGVICTNRVYDALGVAQHTGHDNDLATQLFGPGELTAADTWRLVVTPDDNPFLRTVDELGRPAMALQAIGNVTLVLEHDDGSLVSGTAPTATYGWDLVGFTAYTAGDKTTEASLSGLYPGDTARLVVRAVNVGTASWTPTAVRLVRTEADGTESQVDFVEATVAAGEIGSFEYDFTAPDINGAGQDVVTVTVDGPSLGGGTLTVPYTVVTGLSASYYAGTAFDSLVLNRIDSTVDLDWTTDPMPEVGVEQLSVRWQGRLHPPTSGSYTLVTYSDDGVRLTLDGSVIIDNWTDHPKTRDVSAAQALVAGRAYPVELEYYQGGGPGSIQLCWVPPGGTEEKIPGECFDPGGR